MCFVPFRKGAHVLHGVLSAVPQMLSWLLNRGQDRCVMAASILLKVLEVHFAFPILRQGTPSSATTDKSLHGTFKKELPIPSLWCCMECC